MPIDPRLIYAASNGLDETDGTVAGTTVVKAAVSGFAPVGPMAVLDNTDVAFAAGNGGAIFL
jgi:hypothetical protein